MTSSAPSGNRYSFGQCKIHNENENKTLCIMSLVKSNREAKGYFILREVWTVTVLPVSIKVFHNNVHCIHGDNDLLLECFPSITTKYCLPLS